METQDKQKRIKMLKLYLKRINFHKTRIKSNTSEQAIQFCYEFFIKIVHVCLIQRGTGALAKEPDLDPHLLI